MKTDIKEKEEKFLLDIDLPGYEKENIKMSIEDGYLTINAWHLRKRKKKEKDLFVKKDTQVLVLELRRGRYQKGRYQSKIW